MREEMKKGIEFLFLSCPLEPSEPPPHTRLCHPVVHVHGARPHAQRHGGAALLGDALRRVGRVINVLFELLDDGVGDVVLVKLLQEGWRKGRVCGVCVSVRER